MQWQWTKGTQMVNHSKTVKSLNIAITIVSGLYLLLMLIVMGVLIAASLSGEYTYYYYYSSMDDIGFMTANQARNLIFGLGIGFVGFMAACAALSVIAGILGIKRSAQPDKIGVAFAWAIVGAATSFFCGNIVSMVLHIIAAVYSNKVKNGQGSMPLYAPSGYYQQPYANNGAPGYRQYGAQPVQPAQQPASGQPVQQAAPAQPVYGSQAPQGYQPATPQPAATAPVQPQEAAAPVQTQTASAPVQQPAQPQAAAAPSQPDAAPGSETSE